MCNKPRLCVNILNFYCNLSSPNKLIWSQQRFYTIQCARAMVSDAPTHHSCSVTQSFESRRSQIQVTSTLQKWIAVMLTLYICILLLASNKTQSFFPAKWLVPSCDFERIVIKQVLFTNKDTRSRLPKAVIDIDLSQLIK